MKVSLNSGRYDTMVLLIGVWAFLIILVVGMLVFFSVFKAATAGTPTIVIVNGSKKGANGLEDAEDIERESERYPFRPQKDTNINAKILPAELPSPAIGIRTRGEPPPTQQVGMLISKPLTSEGEPVMLPLFGNPINGRSDRWEYYAAADKQHLWRIPIEVNNRDCTDENVGCVEVYNGDAVTVPSYDGKDFKASIYKKKGLRYLG